MKPWVRNRFGVDCSALTPKFPSCGTVAISSFTLVGAMARMVWRETSIRAEPAGGAPRTSVPVMTTGGTETGTSSGGGAAATRRCWMGGGEDGRAAGSRTSTKPRPTRR